MKSVVGLGTLHEFVIRTEHGERSIRPRGLWLAWDPKGKELLVGRKRPGHGALSPAVRRIHRRFHLTPPRTSSLIEFPDGDAWGDVNLLVSLTYKVPRGVRSPQKNPYAWVHKFGDHGELGHGEFQGEKEYPTRYMPALVSDGRNFWIKRRRGNKYYVTDWLYW